MRVVLDARKIADFGIGTYIRGLVDVLSGNPKIEIVLLGDPNSADVRAPVTWVRQDARKYGVSELALLHRAIDGVGADLFHAPHYVFPLNVRTPGVVTIHDCIHLRHIEQLPRPLGVLPRKLSHQYAGAMMRHAGRAARRVITVSEASRKDLVDRVGIDSKRIDVIPNGVDPSFGKNVPADVSEAIRRRLRLPERYLLFVGNAKPHKNLPLLVAAFERARLVVGDLGLVVVGSSRDAIPDCPEGVITPGFVDHETLRVLYQQASVLTMPSIMEGFGLPILEAMSAGTPVIAADASSLPEVVGDAGLLAPPLDVGAWVTAIERVLTEQGLSDDLCRRGRDRAAAYTWERAAAATLDSYRRALDEAPEPGARA
jgi:glycosyltransferase involved in cell wall biosynthesis